MNNQKIKKIRVENIKGIREIEIYPDETFNEISGENGAGKSSILDSILMAFAGKKYIPDNVVRHGEKRGEIEVETEDLRLCLKVKNGSSNLTVKAKAGKLGQRDLNDLFSKIGFDPLEFSRAKLKEKVEIIREALGLEFNKKYDELDETEKTFYDERRDVGRRATAFGDLELPAEVNPVSISDLTAELKAIHEYNNKKSLLEKAVSDKVLSRSEIENSIDRLKKEFDYKESNLCAESRGIADRQDAIQSQIRDLKEENERLNMLDKEVDEKQTSLFSKFKIKESELKASLELESKKETGAIKRLEEFKPADTLSVEEKIESAEQVNIRAQEYNEAKEQIEEKRSLEEKYENLTKEIDSVRDQKLELIDKSKLPVENLAFDWDGIYIGDTPIENLSSAEKLIISTKIASAINPTLRVITIRDGSLLDKTSFDMLKIFASENNLQLWVETVGERSDSLVIRDGEILQGGE